VCLLLLLLLLFFSCLRFTRSFDQVEWATYLLSVCVGGGEPATALGGNCPPGLRARAAGMGGVGGAGGGRGVVAQALPQYVTCTHAFIKDIKPVLMPIYRACFLNRCLCDIAARYSVAQLQAAGYTPGQIADYHQKQQQAAAAAAAAAAASGESALPPGVVAVQVKPTGGK